VVGLLHDNGIFTFLLTKLDNGEPNSQPLRLGEVRPLAGGLWGGSSPKRKKSGKILRAYKYVQGRWVAR